MKGCGGGECRRGDQDEAEGPGGGEYPNKEHKKSTLSHPYLSLVPSSMC